MFLFFCTKSLSFFEECFFIFFKKNEPPPSFRRTQAEQDTQYKREQTMQHTPITHAKNTAKFECDDNHIIC